MMGIDTSVDFDPKTNKAYECPVCHGHNCEFGDAETYPTEGYLDGAHLPAVFICKDCGKEYKVDFRLRVETAATVVTPAPKAIPADKAGQFELFKHNVQELMGDDFVGTVGPDRGQFGFACNEPACDPRDKARYIDQILEAKSKYPALARCPVMPFEVSGKTVYAIAGI